MASFHSYQLQSRADRSATISMRLTVTTWNINSVRLRINLVARFLRAVQPDVLCLQETKCPDDRVSAQAVQAHGLHPLRAQRAEGLSRRRHRLPRAVRRNRHSRLLRKTDAAIAVKIGGEAGFAAATTLHNFYVPAGGEARPRHQRKIRPRLAFLDEMRARRACIPTPARAILVSDPRNVAPLEARCLEPQTTAPGGLHTPIECEKLNAVRDAAPGSDIMRAFVLSPPSSIRGGATAPPTGRRWTAADASITSGSHRRSRAGYRAWPSPGRPAVGASRLTMSR